MDAVAFAAGLGREETPRAEALLRFYASRDYRPAWLKGDGLSREGAALLRILRAADREGLPAARYRHPVLETADRAEAASLGEIDLRLTDAFLRYASTWDRAGSTPPPSTRIGPTARRRSTPWPCCGRRWNRGTWRRRSRGCCPATRSTRRCARRWPGTARSRPAEDGPQRSPPGWSCVPDGARPRSRRCARGSWPKAISARRFLPRGPTSSTPPWPRPSRGSRRATGSSPTASWTARPSWP